MLLEGKTFGETFTNWKTNMLVSLAVLQKGHVALCADCLKTSLPLPGITVFPNRDRLCLQGKIKEVTAK